MNPTLRPRAQSPALTRAETAHRRGQHESPHYAVSIAPEPGSSWWHFGCWWLGRDALNDTACEGPAGIALPRAYVRAITQEPRSLGFHAMLHAPLRLGRLYAASNVYMQVALVARQFERFTLSPLALCRLDGIVALVPAQPCPEAQRIAEFCAAGLDNLRAPPYSPLVPPRLHFALTCRLPASESETVIAALSPVVERLNAEALRVDALALFVQPRPDRSFVLTRRCGFDETLQIYSR